MRLRPFQKTTSSRTRASLQLLVQPLILLSAFMVTIQAQRPGVSQPARDMVRAIGMKEMDRLLLYKPIVAPKDDSARKVVLKQISEDFKGLQGVNNKMMAEAWSQPQLDYRYISDMVSQLKGKASRLKLNLSLPAPDALKSERRAAPVTDKDFRTSLLILDQTIMRFVKNPLFQNPNTIEVKQATQARHDLESVIELTADLRKAASRLGKAGTR